ncbi:hypothetical protein M5D96_011600, partial [Drosophila gunungcola]
VFSPCQVRGPAGHWLPLNLAAPIPLAGVGRRSRSAAAAAAAPPHGPCREGDPRPPAQHAALRERRAGMPLPAVHAQAAALLGAGRGGPRLCPLRRNGGPVAGLQ